MILTVGNTKGGVGKTSLSLNLAVFRASAGRRVWIIDGDRQGTAATAMMIRGQSGRLPFIPCDHLHDGKALKERFEIDASKHDDVLIDAGGRDSSALRAGLVLSNAVLVPFAPRSLDMWALSDMCELIKEAQALNPSLKAMAVLSCADSLGNDNIEAIEALKDFPSLTYLPTPIKRRKSVANAAGQGLAVLELRPKDTKAIAEVQALVNAVFISC